jgi:FkbM family methyltransferase
VTPVQLFKFFSENGVEWNNYWLTTDSGVLSRHSSDIENFRSSLTDDESLNLLSAILKYRENGLVSDLPIPYPISKQYLADDLRTPPINLNIIDLGACQGENLEYFIEAGRVFEDGYLLEPDAHNFAILKSKLSKLNLNGLSCLQLGAWEKSTILKFDSSGSTSASFSDTGIVEVEVVALDDFIPENFRTNFIKMDIEGAELNALKGMVQVIKRDNPHLAISIYHKPQDLWEIGNFLSLTFPNVYNYYLRMYGHQTFDTILYAIPR